MKKIIGIIIVIIVLILILAFSRSESSAKKIGVISPLTGWGAYWGEGFNKGINMAADEIRAKGGNLEVIIEDGGTDAQKSATAAQKLVNIDKVDALMVEFAAPSSAVSPIALQNKLPMIYDALVRRYVDENPNAFKFYFDVGKQCLIAADYLARHGAKNIAAFSVNVDFAGECKASVDKVVAEKGIKGTIYTFNADTTDFRTLIAKMKNDGIDGVIPVFYEDHAVAFFKQKYDLGFKAVIFSGIGIPDALTEKVRSSVPTESIEGVMIYDQLLAPDFKDKLMAKYKDATEKDLVAAAYGYDEVMYLWGGLDACSKGDSQCVVEAIKKDEHVGVVQSPGFGSDRIFDMTPVYYKINEGKLVEFSPTE